MRSDARVKAGEIQADIADRRCGGRVGDRKGTSAVVLREGTLRDHGLFEVQERCGMVVYRGHWVREASSSLAIGRVLAVSSMKEQQGEQELKLLVSMRGPHPPLYSVLSPRGVEKITILNP